MIRLECFNAIKDALLSKGLAKHVDMWNENVAFIDEDAAWERPAGSHVASRWFPYGAP